MLYSRRCLEVMITDLCECELKRPRKTEPLKGIIDKLHKEEKVPSHIITSMHGLNELSTYGAHPKDFDPEQVKPVLNNLATVIKWYLKFKGTETEINKKPDAETRQEIKSTENRKRSITISRKRLAGLLSVLIALIASVFAVLYFSKIIGDGRQTKEAEKSIAVLPFLNYQNFSMSMELSYRVLKKDPANLEALRNNLLCYAKLGKYEDAYHTAINILKIWNERGYSPQSGWEYFGYVFLKTGHTNEAKYYFDKQIKLGKEVLTLDPNDSNIKMVLAEVYAVLGEKGKAFELLNISKDVNENHSKTESNILSYSWLFMFKYNPAFENLCNDPLFQQYVNQLETDFNAGHEKLKAWLEEKGMLKVQG